MKKIFDNLQEMTDEEIKRWLNEFAEKNCVSLALSKECRDHLADRGIYWPYKKFEYESL